MGGPSVESVFAGLGSAFDFYAGPGDPSAPPGRRYPSAALAAVLSDAGLRTDFLLSFQTTIGIVNAQRAMDGLPRLFLDSVRHRDVTLASARILPESLPDPADPRLQFEWTLAVANGRLVLGTSRALVAGLVDRALDGQLEPRGPGDDAELFGPEAAALLRGARDYLSADLQMKDGRSPEDAERLLRALEGFLERSGRARARLHLRDGVATLAVRAEAAALLGPAPERR
jgi:hypothetical protein